MSSIFTTCPRCKAEDVKVLAGACDFNSTTITVSRCQDDPDGWVSVQYRKSAVLAVEAANEAFWAD